MTVKTDLDGAIFRPQPKNEELKTPIPTYYCLQADSQGVKGGPPVRKDLDNKVVAYTDGSRFFIKRNARTGKLWQADVVTAFEEKRFENERGYSLWQFKSVKETAFAMYINYLATMNDLWISHAERELF